MFASLFGVFLLLSVNTKQLSLPAPEAVIGERSFPMSDRYGNEYVSNVFKDNILLTLSYLSGKSSNGKGVNWDEVEKPFTYDVTLQKGQIFAFHDTVLPQYDGKVTLTTHAHFNSTEGFKSDGYLVADGVCHLASLINWAARDAGLDVVSPTSHDFAVIPDVPAKYGVAIYDTPDAKGSSALQNLYITNNKEHDVTIRFTYDGTKLDVKVLEKK